MFTYCAWLIALGAVFEGNMREEQAKRVEEEVHDRKIPLNVGAGELDKEPAEHLEDSRRV